MQSKFKFPIQIQRGFVETVADLLEKILTHPGISKTTAASYAGIGSKQYNVIFEFLLERGFLITQQNTYESFYLTAKGKQWLLKAKQVYEAVA